MGTLEHGNITPKKKKVVFAIMFICGFLFFVLNTNSVKAAINCNNFCQNKCGLETGNESLCRLIGAKSSGGELCSCCKKGEIVGNNLKYQCVCQNDNKVVDCYVGGLFKGDRTAVCLCCGDCSLNDLLYIGVSIAELILKYLGVVALFLFILGGIIWITSGGAKQKIEKGITIIKGAIVGMIIVIVAFLAVRLIMKEVLNVGGGEMPESIPESSSKEYKDFS